MSYWNGTHWVREGPTPPPRQRSGRANWVATSLMAIGLVALIIPASFIAAASPHTAASGCSVSTGSADVGEVYMVSAWGIPTGTAVNLWVTENGVTTGSPLGSTPDGTFNLSMSSQAAGVTTYTFSGPTRKHMAVYGTCTVSAY
jgi:hypothetical protein